MLKQRPPLTTEASYGILLRMIMDYLENTIQLIVILAALLISLFQYIAHRNRRWFYVVAFYVGNLLSCYFWAAYLVIMGDTPNVSDLLAYFGWDIAYVFLALFVLRDKSAEERRFFHVLLLVPIPLNIWQLLLYAQFGGVINSIYQVAIGTVIICGSLQTLLWHEKKRGEGLPRPYAEAAALLYAFSEFGMWTTSCFDGWVADLYYPFSFLCSISLLILPFAVARSLRTTRDGESRLISIRMQRILQISYAVVVIGCSLGGILFGVWIRNVLMSGLSGGSETDVYDIITIILFLISSIIAASVTVIIFVVYFEQKVLENNRLREARQAADQSNAAKSEFLASMSHEIRTPMNAVLGMNEMVLQLSRQNQGAPPEDPERIRQVFGDIRTHAENIDSAGKSLLAIINDILDFSKIEAGKMEIREDQYALSSVLNDVSNMIAFRAQARGLEYRLEVDERLPDRLIGDAVRIRQVILNILNNAVKYTREGRVTLLVKGSVMAPSQTVVTSGIVSGQPDALTAGTAFRPDHEAALHPFRKGQRLELVITVQDTGIGIREEDLKRLFDRFERMDLNRNNTIEGTGLGLAITKKLLELMNGSVEVKSIYGMGSEFTLHLPQVIDDAEPIGNFRERFEKNREAARAEEETFFAPDARILVVDDTRMNLMVAEGLLKDTQITIDSVMSGAEAIACAAGHRYDLILMDQRMPEMDGAEVMRRIHEEEKRVGRKATPVICLTADALAGARQRYVAQGFTDYLSKPIDQNVLLRMVRKYLPKDKVSETASGSRSTGRDRDGTARSAGNAEDAAGTALYGEENGRQGAVADWRDILMAAGIDPKQGMRYAGDQEKLYRSLLSEYLQKAAERSDELERYYEGRDIRNYAILIHAMKSNARMIGCAELGDAAERLQNAADAGDRETIEREHAAFRMKYDAVSRAISAALG